MKIVTIIGARPQFIKAAAVSQKLRARATEHLVHTGQHYDQAMSDVFFEQLHIPTPDVNLDIGSGPHGQQTGRMLDGIERILLEQKPDALMVYGDTNSTLAGALAAAKLHIPVIHVEAGLRSYDPRMPEEINRVLTDHVSTLLLCPSQDAVNNLTKEGIKQGLVIVGDVMEDLFHLRAESLRAAGNAKHPAAANLEQYAICTMHRAENTDDPARLTKLVEQLDTISQQHIPIIYPRHPRTKAAMERNGLSFQHVTVIDPVPYDQMLHLLLHARLVLTDSGGLQKEAMWAGSPCLTLRNTTEWTHTIDTGWNRLVDADPLSAFTSGLPEPPARRTTQERIPAAERVVEAIMSRLGKNHAD